MSSRIPAELTSSVGLLVSAAGASASVVCALLFVAPKSISPIDNPTTPAGKPADRGERGNGIIGLVPVWSWVRDARLQIGVIKMRTTMSVFGVKTNSL